MYYLIFTAVFSLLVSVGVPSDSLQDNLLTQFEITSSSQIDLTGKWRVSGGRLNYVMDIEDYGDSAEIWQISQYGNSDRVLNVTYYSKNGSSVRIKTYEDLGVGPTTYDYRLEVVNANTLRGTVVTRSSGFAGLAPLEFKDRITFRRTN